MRRLDRDCRAMRNIVGFVLTFAVVISSAGVASTVGYDQLQGFSESEQLNNAERSLQIVEDNFESLQQGRATVRTSELDLADGSLTVRNESAMRVRIHGTNFNETVPVGALEYRYSDTEIAFENGALFWTGEEGHTGLLRGPTMQCTERQAVVSVATLEPAESDHVAGSTVEVTGVAETRELLFPVNRTGNDSVDDAEKANLTIDSPRADGWEQHFSEAGNWTAHDSRPDTYLCDSVEEVYVRQTVIEVELQA